MFRCNKALNFPKLQAWRRCSLSTKCSAGPRVALLGLKEDRNSSFLQGPKEAPEIIRKSFICDSSNTFCEHGLDIATLIDDFGDFESSSADETHRYLEQHMEKVILKQLMLPLTLGGDHSVSFPLVHAVRKCYSAPITIVHFDAHPDLYPDFQNNPHSHASPFARILEHQGVCAKLISLGIRTANAEQRAQSVKYDVTTIEARHFPAHGAECAALLAPFIPTPDTLVYISFDIDVIEPGLAPGVSHREGGGISVRQAIDAIHAIPGRIIGADLVEFNPRKDVDGITAVVASKLMKELASKMIRSQSV
jgi:arginase